MNKTLQKVVENGIIVSVLLGVAYLLAHQYQKGVLSYYDIPMTVANLNTTNVIEVFITIFSFVYLFYVLSNALLKTAKGVTSYKGKEIVGVTLMLACVIALNVAVVGRMTLVVDVAFLIYIVYLSRSFIEPCIMVREKMKYREKWVVYSKMKERESNQTDQEEQPTLLAILWKTFSKIGFAIGIVLVLCGIYRLAGDEYAKTLEHYYIAKDYSSQVVVYSSSEYYVLMPIEDGVLQNQYQIVSTNEIGSLVKEKTGVLMLKDDG